jgi:hypothetical protein
VLVLTPAPFSGCFFHPRRSRKGSIKGRSSHPLLCGWGPRLILIAGPATGERHSAFLWIIDRNSSEPRSRPSLRADESGDTRSPYSPTLSRSLRSTAGAAIFRGSVFILYIFFLSFFILCAASLGIGACARDRSEKKGSQNLRR